MYLNKLLCCQTVHFYWMCNTIYPIKMHCLIVNVCGAEAE